MLVLRSKRVLQGLHEVTAVDIGDVVDISQTSDQIVQVGYADAEFVVLPAFGVECKSSESLSRCVQAAFVCLNELRRIKLVAEGPEIDARVACHCEVDCLVVPATIAGEATVFVGDSVGLGFEIGTEVELCPFFPATI